DRGAERIKGYDADEIIGEHFSRFYTEEDQREGVPMRALLRAATEGRHEAEAWRVRKDGTRFRASVVIDAIHDDAGKLIGFAKVSRSRPWAAPACGRWRSMPTSSRPLCSTLP